MPEITSIKGRIIYNSRGNKTIELDVESNHKFIGRVCAPSGASVGKHEVTSFPSGGPKQSLQLLNANISKFIGQRSDDPKSIHDIIHTIDKSSNYSEIGGATAFAITIAAAASAAKAKGKALFETLLVNSDFKFPYPLGNILGGGAHAGAGTPDIQEILVCSIRSKTIHDAIETNFTIHKELQNVLQKHDQSFTNGRGDEGGWAPKINNKDALELSARACENLGFILGKDVSLGVDFASSTQWNEKEKMYVYKRAGFRNTPEEQIQYTSDIIKQYKLAYAEDAVHEEAFDGMAELVSKFPNTMITGDDLTVTNQTILQKAIEKKSCNAAILKVNQAGTLYDALQFANLANKNNIKLVTSHRSGESIDSHISHIGIATKSKMLKVGILGGERVAKLNELIRLSEHDLICGMIKI